MTSNALTTPVRAGNTEVANRLVLAPMTNQQSHADGTLSSADIEWLAQRARGGFGIVLTGAWAGADLVALGQAGIYNPDWPQRAVEDGWTPRRPPFTAEELQNVGVTAPFRAYLNENWPGSVA